MKLKSFLLIISVFFLLVALVHLCRVLLHWEFIIGNFHLPYWMNILAFAVTAILAIMAYHFRKEL